MFERFALGYLELVVGSRVLVGMFFEGRLNLNAPPSITFDSDQIEDAGINRKGDIPALGD